MDPHRRALRDTQPACYWLDQDERPPACAGLEDEDETDLVVVGGGFTGLWGALQAKEANPNREVVLVEASRVGQGASGRNGGFAASSLTHGLFNGLAHFPDQMDLLLELGRENYRGFVDSIERYSIDARIEQTGTLDVATAEYQAEDLAEDISVLNRFGENARLLDRDEVRAEVNSPTYVGGIYSPSGSLVDPARLAWGLLKTVRELGVRVYENTPMQKLSRHGAGVEICTEAGRVRGRHCLLATNAFKTPVRSMQRAKVPIWDYVLMTEPLSQEQMDSLGWRNRQGLGDEANQFHYYRLTADNRILWGGYDAIYHFGGRIEESHEQRPESFDGLARRFFKTFPQLEGLRFSHSWGGPIASTTRFCMDVGTAHAGRVSWAVGYTGLGVVASRFGGRAALGLLDLPEVPEVKADLVRRRPLPWPPEPLRSLAIQLTQRELARADRNEGRRGLWLQLLDRLGLGFDS